MVDPASLGDELCVFTERKNCLKLIFLKGILG